MIKVNISLILLLFVGMNNALFSAQEKDRILRSAIIPEGKLEECIGSVYVFERNADHPYWKETNWSSCRIFMDPFEKKIIKIESDAREEDKIVTYLLPSGSDALVNIENQIKALFLSSFKN